MGMGRLKVEKWAVSVGRKGFKVEGSRLKKLAVGSTSWQEKKQDIWNY
jgi:hypothetical protein